jgi:predicted DCC family thiol-disulfide oxidoreductase YuxK
MATESRVPEIEVFFDGGCPLCAREVRFLRRWDRRGAIRFTDIDAAGFQAAPGQPGLDELMARIHAQLPDGRWIEGVEVFRRLYGAIGLGPLVALSRLPGVARLLDWSYSLFARNRRRLFGRCTSDTCGPARAVSA